MVPVRQKDIGTHDCEYGGQTLSPTRELNLLDGAQCATLLFGVSSPSIDTLIVIPRLGGVAKALFCVPLLITSNLDLLNFSFANSCPFEFSHEPNAVGRHSNTAIRAMSVTLLPSALFGAICAPKFLQLFGVSYTTDGSTLLRILLLSAPLSAVSNFPSAYAWRVKRVW